MTVDLIGSLAQDPRVPGSLYHHLDSSDRLSQIGDAIDADDAAAINEYVQRITDAHGKIGIWRTCDYPSCICWHYFLGNQRL